METGLRLFLIEMHTIQLVEQFYGEISTNRVRKRMTSLVRSGAQYMSAVISESSESETESELSRFLRRFL